MRFWRIEVAVVDRLCNSERPRIQVDTFPSKCEEFADSESRKSQQRCNRMSGLSQEVSQLSDLAGREDRLGVIVNWTSGKLGL